MKQIIEVRSNAHYTQPTGEPFELKPELEIIIIHTNGKEYKVNGNMLESGTSIAESRFIVSPDALAQLVTDLQMQQKKMEGIRQNAEKLTSLVRYVSEEPQSPVER